MYIEELDAIDGRQLAAVVGRQQVPLSEGAAARHPQLARLRALAAASAAVIGLLDSPDRVRTLPLGWAPGKGPVRASSRVAGRPFLGFVQASIAYASVLRRWSAGFG